jgi:hypothetical protein
MGSAPLLTACGSPDATVDPVTDEEMRAAVIQVSVTRKPSAANQASFDRAVEEITRATQALIGSLATSAAPRTREVE